MHAFAKKEYDNINKKNFIIKKVLVGSELSAAQQIEGAAEQKDELHYFIFSKIVRCL